MNSLIGLCFFFCLAFVLHNMLMQSYPISVKQDISYLMDCKNGE